MSGWLFDPDGTVLEGPVSHLVCGGVYDWRMLGIWLALIPLVVV